MFYTSYPSDIHMSENSILPMVGYYGLNNPYNANINIIAYYILYMLLMVLIFCYFILMQYIFVISISSIL